MSSLRTFTLPLTLIALGWLTQWAAADVLDEVTRSIPGQLQRASSGLFDPESNADCHHVYPGQRLILADLEGPGEIRHIWFTLSSADRRYPRNVVLRAYWDGAAEPAVESPIGDFFAAGHGMRANVNSAPISVTSYGRALNSYWRMPFRKRAVLELENQGWARVSVYCQAEWLKLDSLPDDALYFHARYRQEHPAKALSPYVLFEGVGQGQYVGTVYSSDNMVESWFGEADDRFYVDGETTPSIVGTGTEDYLNDAWNIRVFTHAYHGVTICETKGAERRITAYRWHLPDPVVFTKSLEVEMERRSFAEIVDPETGKPTLYDFKYRPDYVSSVAFWYHKGTMPRTWDFPSGRERLLEEIWVEPTSLVEAARTSPGLKPVRRSNRTCNLKQFCYLRNDAPGGWVEFPFRVGKAGRYAVSVLQSLFREYGVWRVSIVAPDGETVLDPALDFFDNLYSREENWPENHHHGTTVETKLGELPLEPGDHWVRFECVGANPQTRHPETGEFGKGCSLGLDAVNLRLLPVEPHEWLQGYLPAEEKLFAARDREARRTVDALAEAVTAYRAENGRFPASLSDLLTSTGRAGTPCFAGGDIPLDPWQQTYEYRAPGVMNPWSFDLWSRRGDARHSNLWIANWSEEADLAARAPTGALVLEGESLVRTMGAGCLAQDLTAVVEGSFSGGRIVFIQAHRAGELIEFAVPDTVPAGAYDAYILAASSHDYGVVQWSIAGQPIGQPVDGHSERIGVQAAGPGRVTLPESGAVIRGRVVERNPLSAGFYAGLDAVVLVPAR